MDPIETRADLLLGATLLILVSCALFWSSRRLAQRCPGWLTGTAGLLTLLGTLAFVARYYGHLDLARLFPSPRVIIYGNLIPLGAAVLAGLVASQGTIPSWRRTATTGMLIGLAWYTVAYDLCAAAPRPARPRFYDGMSMQTTADTCSVCCAVTLLMEHGIPARESEMMELCLTRRGGTPELGLFRGLKLKTAETPWTVEVLSCRPEAFLEPEAYPAIILVEGDGYGSDPSASRWHLNRADHAVIAQGITESGRIAIRDPSAGPTTWTYAHFSQRWSGGGLRLVPRQQGG